MRLDLQHEGLYVPFPSGLVTTVFEFSVLLISTVLVDYLVYGLFRDSVRRDFLANRRYVPYKGFLWRIDQRLSIDNWWSLFAFALRLITYASVFVIGLSVNGVTRNEMFSAPRGTVFLDWEVRFKFDATGIDETRIPEVQDWSCVAETIPSSMRPDCALFSRCMFPQGTCSHYKPHPGRYKYLKILELPAKKNNLRQRICSRDVQYFDRAPDDFWSPSAANCYQSNDSLPYLCGLKSSKVMRRGEVTAHICEEGIVVYRKAVNNLNRGLQILTRNLRYEVGKIKAMDEMVQMLNVYEESGKVNISNFLEVRLFDSSTRHPLPELDTITFWRENNVTLISKMGLLAICVLLGILLLVTFAAILIRRKSTQLKYDITSSVGLYNAWARWMEGWVANSEMRRKFALTSSLDELGHVIIHPADGICPHADIVYEGIENSKSRSEKHDYLSKTEKCYNFQPRTDEHTGRAKSYRNFCCSQCSLKSQGSLKCEHYLNTVDKRTNMIPR